MSWKNAGTRTQLLNNQPSQTGKGNQTAWNIAYQKEIKKIIPTTKTITKITTPQQQFVKWVTQANKLLQDMATKWSHGFRGGNKVYAYNSGPRLASRTTYQNFLRDSSRAQTNSLIRNEANRRRNNFPNQYR